MNQRSCEFVLLFTCILTFSNAQKHLIFTKIHCSVVSNLITQFKCVLDSNTVSKEISFGDRNVTDFISKSEIVLSVNDRKNAIHLNGIIIDFCTIKTKTAEIRTIRAIINRGLLKSENNFPKKCPFDKNYVLYMRHISFGAELIPQYLPEYNFTLIETFYANNVKSLILHLTGSVLQMGNN